MNTRIEYSRFLEELAVALDITPTQYEEAKKRYEAVGTWLAEKGSPLEKMNPVVYPQGSIRLGTIIKPVTDEDQYDIDLVCKLEATNEELTQKALKNLIGDRLKENKAYRNMLDEEGRKSWTLSYAESTQFHMDIIPAIDDDPLWLVQSGVPQEQARNAICITDMKSETYDSHSDYWPKSNPIGYADWFKDRMKVRFMEQKRALAEQLRAEIETIQDYKVKTPLQRAVQILKRHRDIMFGDYEDKPISIIITTLVAKSYNEEVGLYEALVNIIDNMPNHIETDNGKRVVRNPVNPAENFADKWADNPNKERVFFSWLAKAKQDLTKAFKHLNIREIADNLFESFGERIVTRALVNYLGKTSSGPSVLVDAARRKEALLGVVSQSQVKPWRK